MQWGWVKTTQGSVVCVGTGICTSTIVMIRVQLGANSGSYLTVPKKHCPCTITGWDATNIQWNNGILITTENKKVQQDKSL